MKYLSLFSGIGGFELGIQRAYSGLEHKTGQVDSISQRQETKHSDGIGDTSTERDTSDSTNGTQATCIGYSEIDKYAIKVYERNFNGHTNYGDATTINAAKLPDFDLLVGGFPCQAFSVAGKRQGFNDTRGTLFFDIARILAEKRPRHLLLENVKGLLSHDKGKTYQTILGVLSDLGYRVEWQVLNSKDFGVPQNRERIFIIGHLRGECGRKVFPLTGQGEQDVGKSEKEQKAGSWVSTIDARYGERWSSETYVSEEPRIRRLTPKECERLQGFPDDWTLGESDTQRYKMCGNAVTVNVIEAVMNNFQCLE